jgi:hypothetical protein
MMFKQLLLLFVVSVLQSSAFARTFENELKFYIITPKHRLNWQSPRSLAITSARNSIGNNYAPIGHFAVEVNCAAPISNGVSHVLTGMERYQRGVKAGQEIIKKKLGMGSVVNYSFQGDLQSSEESLKDIRKAKRDGRLKEVIIPTSASRCEAALNFLDSWIQYGSYTVYGGNKDVFNGEGAGCADFALALFHIATSVEPTRDIFVSVNIPKKLIGDGKTKAVPFYKVLLAGSWAKDAENDGVTYLTPETHRVIDFINSNGISYEHKSIYVRHLKSERLRVMVGVDELIGSLSEMLQLIDQQIQILQPYPRTEFKFNYRYHPREAVEKTWARIRLDK